MSVPTISEINPTNYYEHMKRLEQLRRQRDALLRQKQQRQLHNKEQQLKKLLSTLNNKSESIKNSCDYITQHQESILAVLAREGDDHIAMCKATSENVKSIIENIQGVFANCTSGNSGTIKINANGMQNFVTKATTTVNGCTKVHGQCSMVIKTVQQLKNKETTIVVPTVEIHSSTTKRRRGSSLLSDSTFLNTFHSSNVSASSPINNK